MTLKKLAARFGVRVPDPTGRDRRHHRDGADTIEMARSAARVKLRADAVTRSLLKPERGAHRAKIHSAAVTPLIVIWGLAQDHVSENFQIDGIEFVGGRRLLDRLTGLTGAPGDRDAAADALKRLKSFGRTRGHQPSVAAERRNPPPPVPQRGSGASRGIGPKWKETAV